MDDEKRLKRGYNQTELITKIIAENTLLIEEKIVKKSRNTKTQSLLNPDEREKNIKNAFFITNIEKVKKQRIVLFDDIYTTGATTNEISQKLKEAGAKEILILVIAKD